MATTDAAGGAPFGDVPAGGTPAGGAPVPASPRALRVVTTVVLAAFVLLGLPGYVLAGRAYNGNHALVAENKQIVRAEVTAGDRVWLGVKVHHTVNGLWATAGLNLMLDGRAPLAVSDAVPTTWGSHLSSTTSSDDQDVTVGGAFVVPATDAGRTVKGVMIGTIDYPSGAFLFTNEQLEVAVPVVLTITPAGSGAGAGTRTLLTTVIWVDLVVGTVLIVLLAVRLAAALIARVRFAALARARGVPFAVARPGAVVGVPIAALLTGGVLGLVVALVLFLVGPSHAAGLPSFISGSSMRLAGVVAVVTMFTVARRLVSGYQRRLAGGSDPAGRVTRRPGSGSPPRAR